MLIMDQVLNPCSGLGVVALRRRHVEQSLTVFDLASTVFADTFLEDEAVHFVELASTRNTNLESLTLNDVRNEEAMTVPVDGLEVLRQSSSAVVLIRLEPDTWVNVLSELSLLPKLEAL